MDLCYVMSSQWMYVTHLPTFVMNVISQHFDTYCSTGACRHVVGLDTQCHASVDHVFCAPKNFRFGSRSDQKRTEPDHKEPFAEVRFWVR